MKKRIEKCKYCNKKLEDGTTRKSFCSDKCRVYWHRENGVKGTEYTPQLQPTSAANIEKFNHVFKELFEKTNVPPDTIQSKIQEYENEIKGLADVGLAKKRKEWCRNKIYELKKQLK